MATGATSALRVSRHMHPHIAAEPDYHVVDTLRSVGEVARMAVLEAVAAIREFCASPLVAGGELTRDQIATLVARSWSGPVRYRVTQPIDRAKARRTLRRSARIYQAARKPELC